MPEGIHSGHRERLRARFLAEGFGHFQPHEVLEFLLFFGIPRKDTNELAHVLIDTFGNFAEVLDAPYEALCAVKGMTGNAAAFLKSIPAAGKVYLMARQPASRIMDTPQMLGEYFQSLFFGETLEQVWMLCMDSSLNVICCEQAAKGTVSSTPASARVIAEFALLHNCSRVAIAHNHPRGLAVPSNEDIRATRTLNRCLQGIEIELVDHVIVAGGDYVSLRDSFPTAFE